MAITIGQRKRTTIGYTGTTGGRLSWINQATVPGEGMASLGKTIQNVADDLGSIFDKELDESEKRQQSQELQKSYNLNAAKWSETFKNGGSDLDANGVPQTLLDPKLYGEEVDKFHNAWWAENVEGKELDEQAVSMFGSWYAGQYRMMHDNATTLGRKQRVATLGANDSVVINGIKNTIRTNASIQAKNDAFDRFEDMYNITKEGGAVWRDMGKMSEIRSTLKQELTYRTAYEVALGNKGLNAVVNDLETGYSSKDYETAITRIAADKTIDDTNKKKLTTFFKQSLSLRLKAEKKQEIMADEAINQEFFSKHIKGKLTIQEIEASHLDADKKMYWLGQLEGGTKDPWKPAYNDIKRTIQSGTWVKANDITRNIFETKNLIRIEAYKYNIPADEVEKLLGDADQAKNDSETTAALNLATKHAERVFKGPVSLLEKLLGGGLQGGDLDAMTAKMAAADDKIYRFTNELQKQLKAGRKDATAWLSMLTPGDDEYIVDKLIDTINGTTPESAAGNNKPANVETVPANVDTVEEVSVLDETMTDFSKWYHGDNYQEADVTHEIYGNKSYYASDVSEEMAKAITDTNFANLWHGQGNQRLVFPEGHPGHSQYPSGKETIEAYLLRKKLLGLK
ncbi:MAG: hypothetical protein NZ824_12285 [Candidatus Thioglobus sp.]|nr:hypothetical protein [Candidatus Thioglobus sp.]